MQENLHESNISGNPKTEVLSNLNDVSGKNIHDWIISSISKPQSILAIMGRPGAGKTTVINQIYRETERSMPGKIGIISFDVARAGLIKELGKETSSWLISDWEELNIRLILGMQYLLDNGKNVLLESVALGPNTKDRGATAVKYNKFKNIYKKTTLALIPEDLSRVIDFRRFVGRQHEFNGLKSIILNNFNIDMGKDFDDSEVSGREIIELISHMAQEEHLVGIDNEVNKILIPEWVSKNKALAHDKLNKVKIDNSRRNFRQTLRPEAAYMNWLLESWGFDNEHQKVAINWQLNETIHM